MGVLSIGGTRANVEYICVEMDIATHPARQPGYCTGSWSHLWSHLVPSPVVAPTACSPSSPSSTDDDSSDDEEPVMLDANTTSALTDSLASIGVEGGAVAGIAVGCFFFGLLLGVLLTCVCKQKTTPSVTSSTTKAVEVVKTDAPRNRAKTRSKNPLHPSTQRSRWAWSGTDEGAGFGLVGCGNADLVSALTRAASPSCVRHRCQSESA